MLSCFSKHKVCILENDFYLNPLFFVDFCVGLIHHRGKAAGTAREGFRRCQSAKSFEFTQMCLRSMPLLAGPYRGVHGEGRGPKVTTERGGKEKQDGDHSQHTIKVGFFWCP